MKERQVNYLRGLIDAGNGDRFYSWRSWRRLSAYVRKLDRNECQRCKAQGKYSPAEIVHHVKHLQERPELAMSIYDPDTGERQLISLCRACHELEHPERLRTVDAAAATPLTEERWD